MCRSGASASDWKKVRDRPDADGFDITRQRTLKKSFGTFRPRLPSSVCRAPGQEAFMGVRRSLIAIMLGLLAVPALPGHALAGGSWLSPERSAYVPGESAAFHGVFSSGSLEGRIADGPYFAYLLPQNKWIEHHKVPASAIGVGELMIDQIGEQLFRARVEFEVPAVSTGMYHIGYCNEPCTVDGIGDLIGGESIAIGATRTEARLLIVTRRLRAKVALVAQRHQETLTEHGKDLRTAEARASWLSDELAQVRHALRVERSRGSWEPMAGAVLLALGLFVIIVVMAARLRRVRIDAELQALTHSEPVGAARRTLT